MAPEIFEKRYKSSIFQARTPKTPVTSHARTPVASHARTPKTPKVDSDGQTGQQQDDISNKHRDIWAFGCVLYELATHRRPWYEETETSVSEPQCSTKPQTPADLKKFFARYWKKLGPFHGGWCCSILFMLNFCLRFLTTSTGRDTDTLELKFPTDRRIPNANRDIPPCLVEAIRLCTQKNLDQRPYDIEVIIKELEQGFKELDPLLEKCYSSIGSKRTRD